MSVRFKTRCEWLEKTRKKDVTSDFKRFKYPSDSTVLDYFGSVEDVNSKAYRGLDSSLVGNPLFVHAAWRAFRLRGEFPGIFLMQLSFCCVPIIREFSAQSVESLLYNLAPETSFDENLEMHQLTVESHRKKLAVFSLQLTVASHRKKTAVFSWQTASGWKTPDLIAFADGHGSKHDLVRETCEFHYLKYICILRYNMCADPFQQ